jgi:branched-subunit amino acid transport protein AzlD
LISTRPDRVQVWASQLAANDFPPVCAMTGRPAETWRKFRFSTPPDWSYALYVLVICGGVGLVLGAVVVAAVAQRASGFLPLTRDSSRVVFLARWVPAGLIAVALVLCAVVVIAALANVDSGDPNASTLAGLLFLGGVFALALGLVGRLVTSPLISPRAKVRQPPGYYDKLVELRNVHPAFVAAVNQIHQARVAQYASIQAQPIAPPLAPGSI